MALTQFELDTKAAQVVLYEWACGIHTDDIVQTAMTYLNIEIDLKQRDRDNLMVAKYRGKRIVLEI